MLLFTGHLFYASHYVDCYTSFCGHACPFSLTINVLMHKDLCLAQSLVQTGAQFFDADHDDDDDDDDSDNGDNTGIIYHNLSIGILTMAVILESNT